MLASEIEGYTRTRKNVLDDIDNTRAFLLAWAVEANVLDYALDALCDIDDPFDVLEKHIDRIKNDRSTARWHITRAKAEYRDELNELRLHSTPLPLP